MPSCDWPWPSIRPCIRTGSPAESSTRPPTCSSKASPARAPRCFEPADQLVVGHRGDQGAPRAGAHELLQGPGGGAGAVAVVGQYDRRVAVGGFLAGAGHAAFDRFDAGGIEQVVARAPRGLGHVARNPLRQFGLAVGQRLDGHADIGHVRPGKTEEDIDVGVGLAGFPGQGRGAPVAAMARFRPSIGVRWA